MKARFRKKTNIVNIVVTAVSAMLSVSVMLYAVAHFGVSVAGPELVLNAFYIASLVMMWMYFFYRLTTQQFNYCSTLCLGMTVLLRDILFPPIMANFALHLSCLTLSVILLQMLTFFYARKNWKSYSRANLWWILIVDALIASIYNYALMLETVDEATAYLMTEIWIRPTITYGLVACFVAETKEK